MTAAESDILAYLMVLNHQPTLQKLSPTERQVGTNNIMGCLHRVEDFLIQKDWRSIVSMLKNREKLNGRYPVTNTALIQATAELSETLYTVLHPTSAKVLPWGPTETKFLNSLDAEFSKILGKLNESASH